jgi:putative DNA primase/helicase
VLNWSLAGLERLEAQGRFTRPPHVEDTIRTLEDLASPVNAFVRDMCVRGPDESVLVDELWKAWRSWSEENGYGRTTKTVFGRDLRAVMQGRMKRGRVTVDGKRKPAYFGVGLRPEAVL